MAKERNSFVFLNKWADALDALDDRETADAILHAIVDYGRGREVAGLSPVASGMWSMIRVDMDAMVQHYQDVAAKRAEAAKRKQNEQMQQIQQLQEEKTKQTIATSAASVDDNIREYKIRENKIIEDNKRENKERITRSPNGSVVMRKEELCKELRELITEPTQTAEDLRRASGLTTEELCSRLDEFQRLQVMGGEESDTRRNYRQHFANWLKIQLDKERKQGNGTYKQPTETRLTNIGKQNSVDWKL